MSVTIQGKITEILPEESGVSKAGKEWRKQSMLLEQNVDFNKIVIINAFGEDKIKSLNKFKVGDTLDVCCNVYSREWNGKYFTSLDGYWFANQNAEVHKNTPSGHMQKPQEEDDLPF